MTIEEAGWDRPPEIVWGAVEEVDDGREAREEAEDWLATELVCELADWTDELAGLLFAGTGLLVGAAGAALVVDDWLGSGGAGGLASAGGGDGLVGAGLGEAAGAAGAGEAGDAGLRMAWAWMGWLARARSSKRTRVVGAGMVFEVVSRFRSEERRVGKECQP